MVKLKLKLESLLHEYDAGLYFQNIFQSKHTRNHPTTADIANELNTYEMHIPILDDILHRSELEYAIKHIGKGCGMDGITASVIRLIPLLNNVLKLLQKTFIGNYSKSWEEQILNALPKEGHTSKTPKLCGIAISQIFPRIYDCILDSRFNQWYNPNREQGQGCLLQIFAIVLLIHNSKEKKIII